MDGRRKTKREQVESKLLKEFFKKKPKISEVFRDVKVIKRDIARKS